MMPLRVQKTHSATVHDEGWARETSLTAADQVSFISLVSKWQFL